MNTITINFNNIGQFEWWMKVRDEVKVKRYVPNVTSNGHIISVMLVLSGFRAKSIKAEYEELFGTKSEEETKK